MKKIAIIGGGNLGGAIARGLALSNAVSAEYIFVTTSQTSHFNTTYAAQADVVILCVKPYQIEGVLQLVQPVLTDRQVIVSVAARVGLEELAAWTGKSGNLFRAMPNIAAAHGESMTCLSSLNAEEENKRLVETLFTSIGQTAWIDESLFNAATVLSGSGIAFAIRYARACMQAGIQMGFRAEMASLITGQTIKGAMQILLSTHIHPEAAIDQVTTPKGCTIAGLNEMEHLGLSGSVIGGIMRSHSTL